MAISTKGVIAYKFYEKGGSNKERFLNFLQENILFKMKNKLLLFDNARSHTAKDILENIKESENDYILNVPYNPQTNPIESFFSEFRKNSNTPIVIFTYLNPIYNYGFEKFHEDASSAGVDGILILDLPQARCALSLLAPQIVPGFQDLGLQECHP